MCHKMKLASFKTSDKSTLCEVELEHVNSLLVVTAISVL